MNARHKKELYICLHFQRHSIGKHLRMTLFTSQPPTETFLMCFELWISLIYWHICLAGQNTLLPPQQKHKKVRLKSIYFRWNSLKYKSIVLTKDYQVHSCWSGNTKLSTPCIARKTSVLQRGKRNQLWNMRTVDFGYEDNVSPIINHA